MSMCDLHLQTGLTRHSAEEQERERRPELFLGRRRNGKELKATAKCSQRSLLRITVRGKRAEVAAVCGRGIVLIKIDSATTG